LAGDRKKPPNRRHTSRACNPGATHRCCLGAWEAQCAKLAVGGTMPDRNGELPRQQQGRGCARPGARPPAHHGQHGERHGGGLAPGSDGQGQAGGCQGAQDHESRENEELGGCRGGGERGEVSGQSPVQTSCRARWLVAKLQRTQSPQGKAAGPGPTQRLQANQEVDDAAEYDWHGQLEHHVGRHLGEEVGAAVVGAGSTFPAGVRRGG